ncbi:mannitol 2-dehydrogenase [Rubricella aquisinus]|uniref:Mannitol 2-dehydrogenase n=1 Tax=Rubricella aquisinus TaxID=2028108 RepID=A0A840X1H7_9RHOB|nr:mannitol dehydrogenase family protein [Rubricella aquisinus]MBB5516614.1 mannitol 2-dehydrogenase [Rubricella aquisinus]
MKLHAHEAAARALRNDTLGSLPEAVEVPRYDRSALTPGIVHIGVGNFHRAHQAWYLHKLMQQGLAQDWAIIGAGVRPGDAMMREKLLAQDCLTTLIELDPDGTSVEVIGSMIGFVEVHPHNQPLIAALTDPRIRIVSLTVTEGGYYQTATGALDTDHPDIQHDIVHPDRPVTAFGAMIAAYAARRAAGHPAFTGQCCDNLQENGAVLRRTILSLAERIDPDLAAWIEQNASFPNAMVDCIVPATGPAELSFVQQLGIADAAPVTHENYRKWVIEDAFCAGRPPWEDAGVVITDDVHTHESMKIRVLNAGHQVLANAGEILGLETIADCMADPQISAFFNKVETDGILPHVDPVPGVTTQDYLALIEKRFANPLIRDTTRRVAFDGSSRHPGFLLPILREAIAAGQSIDGLALVEALWARMCAGTRETGDVIAPNDPMWTELQTVAHAARTDPQAWLLQGHIYGDLGQDDRFAASFARWLDMLWAKGVRATLATYLSG